VPYPVPPGPPGRRGSGSRHVRRSAGLRHPGSAASSRASRPAMRLSRKRLLKRAACRRSSRVRCPAVRSRMRCLSVAFSGAEPADGVAVVPCMTPVFPATRGSAHRPRTARIGCPACMNGNSSTSPEEESGTGRPDRDPLAVTGAAGASSPVGVLAEGCAFPASWRPTRALSSQTPTSRCRSATAGRPVRARESSPGAGRAATGIRAGLRLRPRLAAQRHARP
jgi:hypothetical protein